MTDAEQERARVVAWLRGEAALQLERAENCGKRGIWNVAADHAKTAQIAEQVAELIERGEHIKEN